MSNPGVFRTLPTRPHRQRSVGMSGLVGLGAGPEGVPMRPDVVAGWLDPVGRRALVRPTKHLSLEPAMQIDVHDLRKDLRERVESLRGHL